MTANSKRMNLCEYIKQYCNNKWKVFEKRSKAFPKYFEQRAYTDETIWIDSENNIIITDIDYIGD